MKALRAQLAKERDQLQEKFDESTGDVRANIAGLVVQMTNAIGRIDAGTYGTCTSCGGDIDPNRLKALPHAPLCLDCKRKGRDDNPRTDVGDIEDAPAKQFEDIPIPEINRGGDVQTLPVSKIKPSPDNPRTDVGDIEDLAASIMAAGLIHPLQVAPNGEGYEIVAGHRRFAAIQHIGWDEVRVEILANSSEKERREIRLIENLHREDLSPLEEARGYQQLVEHHGMTQRDLSVRIGRSQSHVSKRLALIELPQGALDAVDSGRITLDTALQLLKLREHPEAMAEAWSEYDEDLAEVERRVADAEASGKKLQRWETAPPNLDWQIDQRVRTLETERKRAKELERLQAKDIKVVVKRPGGKAQDLGRWGLDIPAKDHQSEPCHVVYLPETASRGEAFCKNPERHAPDGASELKSEKAAGPGAAAKTREGEIADVLNNCQKRRHEFVKSLIAKDLGPSPLASFKLLGTVLAEAASESNWGAELDTAVGEWLPLKGKTVKDWYDDSPEKCGRLALATAVRNTEWKLDENESWKDADVAAYFAFLETYGYVPAGPERALLDGREVEIETLEGAAL